MALFDFAPDRGAGLDDRKLVVAEQFGGAPCAGEILGADPLVHPRAVVVAGEEVAEHLQHVGLDALRQFVRPPRVAHQPARAVAIAFS